MSLVPDTSAAEPIPEEACAEVERLLATGDLFRYTAGERSPVSLLERDFAAFLGSRYALAVTSCSAALFLAMKALDLPRGARVLMPAFTFAAVPSSILHAECTPVLVEVGQDYRIDIDDFRAKLPGAHAVLISHMRGHTSDMDAIMAVADSVGIPVIEDAAHSLGTTWGGRNIGTIGQIGCFSFQSYKLLNAGEGGVLVTDDAELIARAVIMSGAYEHNWRKHPVLQDAFGRWQNRLPLYNTRLNNLSAAIVRPQIADIPRRVHDGRRNHDHVASRLDASPWFSVPRKRAREERAPDSIQFNILGMTDEEVCAFAAAAAERGVPAQIFGLSEDNARAFWNWQFLGKVPDLPMTRSMLMRACDTRLPARLTLAECDMVADALLEAVTAVMQSEDWKATQRFSSTV